MGVELLLSLERDLSMLDIHLMTCLVIENKFVLICINDFNLFEILYFSLLRYDTQFIKSSNRSGAG